MSTSITSLRTAIAATVLAAAVAAPAAAASPSAVPEPCPPEAEGAVCGHVDVPLDRSDPSAGTIPIAFEQYPHTDPGPAVSAIIPNFGGAGVSTTALRQIALGSYASLRDRHDILLIDGRGRGRSGVIDCPDYQQGTGPLIESIGACADQLGARAALYSTADVAQDYEAVRAALGYGAVDFVGNSSGGVDAAAYASRFGHRLRTLVLNGAVEPAMDAFARGHVGVGKQIERVGAICKRSRACARSAGEAVAAVRRLVRRVRRAPVDGLGPSQLVFHVLDNVDGFGITHGELPAAADALKRGDWRPLLRLAAEGGFPSTDDNWDNGPVEEYSAGAFSAAFCLDNPWPWSADAPLPVRQAQWERAVRGTPDAPFAPFRAEEVMFSPYGMAGLCLSWPATGSRRPVEPGARYTKAPALILDGEFDANVGRAEVNAAHYPNATLVRFKGVNHTPLEWSACARELRVEFIRTRKVGDTSCAAQSLFDNPGVAAFPRRVADSPAARRGRGNRADLRLTRAAADAALDAFKRGFLSIVYGGDGHAAGLRGGTVQVVETEAFTATLDGIRWTDDIAVSGTLEWSFDGGPLTADLQIDGPGRKDGTLHLEGGWLIPGAPRSLAITGTLGGKRVVATTPAG